MVTATELPSTKMRLNAALDVLEDVVKCRDAYNFSNDQACRDARELCTVKVNRVLRENGRIK